MYIGDPAPICSWGRSAANPGSDETKRFTHTIDRPQARASPAQSAIYSGLGDPLR